MVVWTNNRKLPCGSGEDDCHGQDRHGGGSHQLHLCSGAEAEQQWRH